VVLTPERSMAVDGALLPLGAPFWIDTTWPTGTGQAGQPLQRLMVAQDVGGAIKGAVRGDLFWGTGAQALEVAGRLKQPGRYFILLPKTVEVPARAS
jgi:membrane-bound lytic murein transglycosylase A